MTDRVLVPLLNGAWLALEVGAFREALAAGAEAACVTSTSAGPRDEEPLLTAEQLAAALNIKVTWVEQAGREGRIPSAKLGRWRRFNRGDVERALASNGQGRRA